MSGPATWDVIYGFIGFAVGVLLLWWRIEGRIKEGDVACEKRMASIEAALAKQNESRTDEIIAVGKDLADYKLMAADRFASHEHLKEVEVRLTTSIDRLTNRIEQLPQSFAREVSRIVGELLADTLPPRRRP